MNEQIARILKSPWTIPSAVGVVSFGGGLGIGYFLGKRKAEKDLDAEFITYEPDDDDDDETEFFDVTGVAEQRVIIDAEAYHSPAVVPDMEVEVTPDGQGVIVRSPTEQLIDDVADEPVPEPEEPADDEGADLIPDDEEPELVHVNVFDDGDWDWEVEVASRELDDDGKSAKPYILHRDEFYRNEMDYTQTTLTYYQGDDILVPEGEQEPLSNPGKLVGEMRFGHGSGDPNTVLIRNDERRAEYEICLDEGKFAEEVMGYVAEERAQSRDLQHSRVGRFRDTD